MKKHRAILDPDGVYRGHEPFTGKLGPGDAEVPDDCDLEEGRYRWNGKTFLPIASPEPEDMVNELHTLAAIAAGFMAIRDAGTPLPAITDRWLDWYVKTFDAKGVLPNKKD